MRLIFLFIVWMFNPSHLLATTELDSKTNETTVNEAEAFRTRGRIQFEKSLHDFGSVLRGQKLSYKFVFKNVGTGPLEVHGVHASCGCTVVSSPKKKIFTPGEEGFLEVSLDTEHFDGRVQKTISVMTNEIEKSSRLLTLVASVRSEVMASPPVADFGDVLVDDKSEVDVQLVKDREVRLKLDAARINTTIFEVQVVEETPTGSKLKILLKSPQNAGFLKEQLVVPVEGAKLSELRIPLRANIVPSTKIASNYVEFGAVGAGESMNRKVQISSTKNVQLLSHRLEIKLNQEALSDQANWIRVVYPQSLGAKESKHIELSFTNPGLNKIGSIHGRLYVQTDDPKQKELTLDFYGFVK